MVTRASAAQFKTKVIKMIHSTGDGMELAVCDPGANIPDSLMFYKGDRVWVPFGSPEFEMLRACIDKPGVEVALKLKIGKGNLPQVIGVDVKSHENDYTTYKDFKTGDDTRISFGPELIEAHEKEFDALARKNVVNEIMRMHMAESNPEQAPETYATEREIERQSRRKFIQDEAESIMRRNMLDDSRGRFQLFSQFQTRPEFSTIPKELFPLFCLAAAPAHVRDEKGEYVLRDLFKNREEEAGFMRVMVGVLGGAEMDAAAELMEAIPGLSDKDAERLANAMQGMSPKTAQLIQGLYDNNILLSEHAPWKHVWKTIGEIPSLIERIGEEDGRHPLVNILSRELQGAIIDAMEKEHSLSLPNMTPPIVVQLKGEKYELLAPDAHNPTDYVAVGPLPDMAPGDSVYKKFLEENAKVPTGERESWTSLSKVCADLDMRILAKEQLQQLEFAMGDAYYRIGDNGKIFEVAPGNIGATMDEFVRRAMPPNKYEGPSYAFDSAKFRDSLIRKVEWVDNGIGEISRNGYDFTYFRNESDLGASGVYEKVTETDFPYDMADARQRWDAEFSQRVELSPQELLSIEQFGDDGNLEHLIPVDEMPNFTRDTPDEERRTTLRAMVFARKRDQEFAKWAANEKHEIYTNLVERVAEENTEFVPADVNAGLLIGHCRARDGVLYRQLPDTDERVRDLDITLDNEERGIFKRPHEVDIYSDGKWHDSDAENLFMRKDANILRAFRKRVAENYGPDMANLLDNNFYDLVSRCTSEHADEISALTRKELAPYTDAAIRMYEGNATREFYSYMDLDNTDYTLEELLEDPTISWDNITPHTCPKERNISKQLTAHAVVNSIAERMMDGVMGDYAGMVNSPNIKDRLQMPHPGYFHGEEGEISVSNAELTEFGECCIANKISRALREEFKAIQYIRNGMRPCPSGDKVDLELVARITQRLPKEKAPQDCTVAELLEASSKSAIVQESQARANLLFKDKKVFKDKAVELDKLRRKELEDSLTKIFTAPGRAVQAFSRALEGIG